MLHWTSYELHCLLTLEVLHTKKYDKKDNGIMRGNLPPLLALINRSSDIARHKASREMHHEEMEIPKCTVVC